MATDGPMNHPGEHEEDRLRRLSLLEVAEAKLQKCRERAAALQRTIGVAIMDRDLAEAEKQLQAWRDELRR